MPALHCSCNLSLWNGDWRLNYKQNGWHETHQARNFTWNFKLRPKWTVISSPCLTVVRHLIFESLSLDHKTLILQCRCSTLNSAMHLLCVGTVVERQSSADRPYLLGLLIMEELVLWQSLVCSVDYRDQAVSGMLRSPFIKKNEWLEGVRDSLRSYSRYVIWSNNDAPKESWTKEAQGRTNVVFHQITSGIQCWMNTEHFRCVY